LPESNCTLRYLGMIWMTVRNVRNRKIIILGGSFLVCPICGGKAIGKVGAERFFCRDCCVEYRVTDEGIQVFSVSEDGSLIALERQNESICDVGKTYDIQGEL